MSRRNGRIEIERENTKRERHHRNHRAARTAVEKDHGGRDMWDYIMDPITKSTSNTFQVNFEGPSSGVCRTMQ